MAGLCVVLLYLFPLPFADAGELRPLRPAAPTLNKRARVAALWLVLFAFIFPCPLYQRRAREKFATQKRLKWVNLAENNLIWPKTGMRLLHGF